MRRSWQRVRDMWREHPVLVGLALVLLARLLTHTDSYLTVRDLDFFPPKLPSALSWDYRGGRPLSLWLNFLWSELVGWDALLVKQLFTRFYVLAYVPVVVLLADRFGLSLRGQLLALVLVLSNGVVFASHDTLGPYFLLLVFTGLQFVLAVDVLADKPAWRWYCVVTLLALLAHRNALLTTGLTLVPIVVARSRVLYRTVGDAMFSGAVAVLVGRRIVGLMSFDRFEVARQLAVYDRHLFATPYDGGPVAVARVLLEELVQLLPRLAGLSPLPLAGGLVALALLGGALWWGRPQRRLWWFWGAAGLAVALLLVAVTEWFARDLFFRPNHVTYNLVWLPLLLLFLAGALERIPWRVVGWPVLLALVGWNLYLGTGYRQEGYDVAAHDRSVPADSDVHLTVPAFIPNVYFLHFPEGAEHRPFVLNEGAHNDYRTIRSPDFVLDLVEYDEFGTPLYRYRSYAERLRRWAARAGYKVAEEELDSVLRFTLSAQSKSHNSSP